MKFYVRAIVHAEIEAPDAGTATGRLCDLIRLGIGDEPPDAPRTNNVSICASSASLDGDPAAFRINEDFLRRLRR
jgi:hypothetical protein